MANDPNLTATCARCSRPFLPRFRFQIALVDGTTVHYCSQTCREPGLVGNNEQRCSVCQTRFVPRLAMQAQPHQGGHRYFCSSNCRSTAQPAQPLGIAVSPTASAPGAPRANASGIAPTPARTAPAAGTASAAARAAPVSSGRHWGASPVAESSRPVQAPPPRAIAVLNQKGGTAKTTTALSVAAGLAALGHRTLLVDLDPQGNVGVSLGLKNTRTAYHLLIAKMSAALCAMEARPKLDVIISDEGLASAEVELCRLGEKERICRLAQAMQSLEGYAYVILDCAPALSVVNTNALYYAGEVLIPVSCDYLALVGVKQVLRTLRRVTEHSGRQVRVAGVLPTFYDVRNKLSLEALGYLRKTFGPRALPPVRVNTKLAEAPSNKKTIFEYAPESHGARDYMRVVQWLRTADAARPTTSLAGPTSRPFLQTAGRGVEAPPACI